jgi:hypothetical protein
MTDDIICDRTNRIFIIPLDEDWPCFIHTFPRFSSVKIHLFFVIFGYLAMSNSAISWNLLQLSIEENITECDHTAYGHTKLRSEIRAIPTTE